MRKTVKKKFLTIAGAACLLLLAAAVWELGRAEKGTVLIDFGRTVGEIQRLNGINNGPKSGYSSDGTKERWEIDATELYRELGIPVVRTHDSEYPYGQDLFVDIHCIFPDFSRDPDDAGAYNFAYTDKYIAAIAESGAQVLFRLGESIDHSGNDLYIHPPEDYEKWARICEHIVRHYNEGWADGFYYGIEYWEIWNEPDNEKMWTGSAEEYCELYKVTARYLKQIYPDIKIGGYAASECSPEKIGGFLQYIRQDGTETPLDFFSWHTYTDNPEDYAENAELVRELLDANGYGETKSVLDEWNYIKGWDRLEETGAFNQTAKSAAYLAASLISMQEAGVDMAAYYDGQFAGETMAWCGLYRWNGERLPGYYAFAFFRELYEQENEAYVQEELENLYCCAASGERQAILLANYSAQKEQPVYVRLKLTEGGRNARITRINEEHPDGITSEKTWSFGQTVLKLEPGETVYIELTE